MNLDKLIINSVEPKSLTMSISELINKYNEGKIVIPSIQRGFVWKREKAIDLILSLIQGYPIPPVIALKFDYKYIILDGQQRIKSILWFMDKLKGEDVKIKRTLGEPKISPKYVLKKYNRVGYSIDKETVYQVFNPKNSEDLRNWISEKTIEFKVIEVRDFENVDKIIIDIFTRLNRGSTLLSEYDIVRAMYLNDAKPYLQVIEKFDNNSLLRSRFKSDYIFNTRQFDQVLILYDYFVNGGLINKEPFFGLSVRSRKQNLLPYIIKDRAMFIKNSSLGQDFLSKLENQIEYAIKDVINTFGENSFLRPNIHNKYAMITFYKGTPSSIASLYQMLIVTYARKYDKRLLYERKGELIHESIYEFLKEFYTPDVPMSSVGDIMKINELALKVVKKLVNGHSSTYYSRSPNGIKELLYKLFSIRYNREPLCPVCKHPVKFEKSELGHIVPYSTTNTSSILNLVLVHDHCNRYLGNRRIRI